MNATVLGYQIWWRERSLQNQSNTDGDAAVTKVGQHSGLVAMGGHLLYLPKQAVNKGYNPANRMCSTKLITNRL